MQSFVTPAFLLTLACSSLAYAEGITKAAEGITKPAVVGAGSLPDGESADAPATAAGSVRYLFACPEYMKKAGALDTDMKPLTDSVITLKGLKSAPKSVILLGDGKPVENEFKDGSLTVRLPVARRTNLPDVVKVELEK